MPSIIVKISLEGNLVDTVTVALSPMINAVSAFATRLGFTPDLKADATCTGTDLDVKATLNGYSITTLDVPESGALKEADALAFQITGQHPSFDVEVSIA